MKIHAFVIALLAFLITLCAAPCKATPTSSSEMHYRGYLVCGPVFDKYLAFLQGRDMGLDQDAALRFAEQTKPGGGIPFAEMMDAYRYRELLSNSLASYMIWSCLGHQKNTPILPLQSVAVELNGCFSKSAFEACSREIETKVINNGSAPAVQYVMIAPGATNAGLYAASAERAVLPEDCKLAYPPASLSIGEEGKVVVRFMVGTDGQVGNLITRKSSGFGRLDSAVRTGLHSCKFPPAIKDGKPVEQAFELEYSWELPK